MIFLDTSALVKRYVEELGSETVLRLMAGDPDWVASELARSEARIALCRRGPEFATDSPAQRRLVQDWDLFATIPIDPECLSVAVDIACRHRLRTLDAIHLAAAFRLPDEVWFLSFDRPQQVAATALGLAVIPT